MYDISIPCMPLDPTFNRERTLEDLRQMGAKRVFLALPFLSHNWAEMEDMYAGLEPHIRYFQDAGLEVGVWFWTFRFADREAKYTVMVTSQGKACHTSTAKYCPWDEGYLTYMENHVKRLAAMAPDLILFDDDLAFGFASMDAPSCFCKLHREKMGAYLGEPAPEGDGLYEKIFSGKKNRLRSAFLRSHGESLKNFARRMRSAVDSVNPKVRMGQCGCITTFDYDGVDSFTLSKILAGSTKPFLRLIGAPYWDPVKLHGNALCDVIELERMERAWYDGDDIEIVSAGDTYPRPRHRVPASYLEIFDAALRASGGMDGILKYVLCYCNGADYERGYIRAHQKNEKDLDAILEAFEGLEDTGVRVYESMHKIEDADYSHEILTQDRVRYQFFSHASRFLAHNSVPTAHRGSGCAGIAFGENARAMDLSALEKPLILDEPAARILQERGVDVGIASFDGRFIPEKEHYLATGEYEVVTDYRLKPPFAAKLTLTPGAKVETEWVLPDGTRQPGSYTYRNADGNEFLVLALDGFTCTDAIYKNYSRQKQFMDFLPSRGAHLPVKCAGHPELYVLCRQSEDTLSVALFNCFADPVEDLTLELPEGFSQAGFCRCQGSLSGDKVTLERLGAFDWCFVRMTKNIVDKKDNLY